MTACYDYEMDDGYCRMGCKQALVYRKAREHSGIITQSRKFNESEMCGPERVGLFYPPRYIYRETQTELHEKKKKKV